MKTGKKALLLALCAVLLVAATVMGTMAYLADTKTVTNTFSIGSVAITLDEADVDLNGTPKENADRVTQNQYKLMPGHKYTKDPIVHVTAGSEDSWIFVKVNNGISAYEAATSEAEGGYKQIADQIIANGWTALEGNDGVYYKTYAGSEAANLPVFTEFKIADNANSVDSWKNINASTTKVIITAYAVQKDGLTVTEAWNVVKDM